MFKFDFELDDFQKEALERINEGKSVVVCAPTGAGKTCIAEFAIQKALEDNVRLFYTTPLKALSNQKFYDFGKRYGEGNVGLLTGDSSINRDAPIVVMTTEVFRNMLYCTNFGSVKDNMNDVRYVVLDEVHYMNDEQRGTVWEESIIYCPNDIQIIALSATVANSQELCDWINTVHSKTELVYTDFRPVPLRHFYFDSSKPTEIIQMFNKDGHLNKKIKPERREFRTSNKKKQKNYTRDVASILHSRNMLPAIFFTFSRKKCDEYMEKCSYLNLVTPDEQRQIREIINDYIEENAFLENNKHIEFLLQGVASHHAGLLPAWKLLVEKLFQKGLIKVVFATETLAAGINMPARTTVITSVSKRTDSGHRMLTANEFLQMSGRAGRRGMDEVGYVVVMGTMYQSPEEVAMLVKSSSNPLESKFSPGYSMVLNLLQNLEVEQAKELILKSFGYFSSSFRLKPLLASAQAYRDNIEEVKSFKCPFKLSTDDLIKFNKIKEKYVVIRRLYKTLYKQAKQRKQKNAPEVEEYALQSKNLYNEMKAYKCDECKGYHKHYKILSLLERYEKRLAEINKELDKQKDYYWNLFIAHKKVLEQLGYLENDNPTELGIMCATIRFENELYIAEIVKSQVLEGLQPSELASVICALVTEEQNSNQDRPSLPLSRNVRATLNKIKEIRHKIFRIQRDFDITKDMYMNSCYSPLIELWILDTPWEDVVAQGEVNEGDLVRTFKRTVDILRQLTLLSAASDELKMTAKSAVKAILREPVDMD